MIPGGSMLLQSIWVQVRKGPLAGQRRRPGGGRAHAPGFPGRGSRSAHNVAVANKVQTLDGRWLSIDGRVLFKATVAPVVMSPMASLSWTVILEVESPSTGIEVGDAVILDASGPVSGSRPITLRAWPPDRLAWGPQVFTGPTLSMINNTIVRRTRAFRPLCMRVLGLDDGVWTGC
jgi:hypothetical protein